jgi:photosystem II stability/assembly factor-like uncharacterized protein
LLYTTAVPSAAWVARRFGGLLRTDDDGTSWSEIAPVGTNALIYPVSASVAWMASAGRLSKTVDGGRSWIGQDVGDGAVVTSVVPVAERDAWLTALVGPTAGFNLTYVVFRTTDGGATWLRGSSFGAPAPPGLAASSPSVAWLRIEPSSDPRCGPGASSLYATIDGGATWQVQSYGTPRVLTGLAVGSRLEAWAIGRDGSVLATIDGGATWTTQLEPTYIPLNAIAAGSASSLWAVGARGGILRGSPD